MHLRPTARIMLMAPITMQRSQCCQLKGTVLANAPRNSTMITWNPTVAVITATNTQLLNIPLNTFIFSISRLFTSLNTCFSSKRVLVLRTPFCGECCYLFTWQKTKELKMMVLRTAVESGPSRLRICFPEKLRMPRTIS